MSPHNSDEIQKYISGVIIFEKKRFLQPATPLQREHHKQHTYHKSNTEYADDHLEQTRVYNFIKSN